MKKLVVTADDFGLSSQVNEAVELAHRNGILTAASLMVGAPAFAEAVARARQLPRLGIGLHLTLINGRPVLPPEKIPHLVGPEGRFLDDPVWFGVQLFFSDTMRREANAEITAQFERFRETGLPLDHVNGHQHFHIHPVVSGIIARLLPAFGNVPVRIPVEPFGAATDRRLFRRFTWLFYSIATRHLRHRVQAVGSPVNNQVFGLCDSGTMTEARVLAILERLPDGISEIYFHPATARWQGPDNLPAAYRPEDEYAALISSTARAKVITSGARLSSFRGAFAE